MHKIENALKIVSLSDIGKLRSHNEDAMASDTAIGLVVVADGMGGYNAGEVASQMAVLGITANIKTKFQQAAETNSSIDASIAKNIVLNAVRSINQTIFDTSNTQIQCEGMGTTLVLGLFVDNQLVVGHAGDSRAYLLRDNKLSRLTTDHSVIQEHLDHGLLTEEQAKTSPYKNFVTRAMGIEDEVDLELNVFDVMIGDIYMLCTDGLTEMVTDEEITSTIINDQQHLDQAAEVLIKKANQYGGRDNISVMLIQVLKEFSA
jgi:PPM family protein phosphatase